MALPFRSISLCAALLSALFNLACTVRILLSWRTLRWDFSGVDTDTFPGSVDALHLLWGLLTLYFASATTASITGFIGIIRNSPSYVRFFRDYSIADVLFMMMSAITLSYFSFSSSSATLRSSVCDELGRQPELLREVAESGLDLENCEYWFERGIVLMIAMYMVFVVVKVHFVIALAKYYSKLRRSSLGYPKWCTSNEAQAPPLERIYLLPTPTSPTHPSFFSANEKHAEKPYDENAANISAGDTGVMVYAPVPLGQVSLEEGRGMGMREAWMSSANALPSPTKKHHRHHSSSQSHHHRVFSHSGRSSTKSHRHHRSMDALTPPENSSL
ncbi:hypothetical protein PHLGIDRAFT_29148 [Phlebiopsis gigantea 11061_1 CR5-6]|uniref:Uncharacterized protein n=1 Tax=Phlebiopsis gigantea (strain 11061_1 CR5-6) TaxID=745531 RepID=A0A0C3S1U8_PHLG1|nr:hypothetical protein PHLGIDRAFT_29148 [Phlebiopsis gigantea 11061_1 CR5-6]